jgi:hypothetical protein
MRPADDRLRAVFSRLVAHLERRWSIPVVIRDVPNPYTGDLDGAEIHVDYDLDIEDAVFIVAHLFGHTVQWNTSPAARAMELLTPGKVSPAELAAIQSYEAEACRYSLQLFHEAGITDLDPWLSDFAACDYRYLEHFYRTAEKPPFRSFWRDGEPVLQPLAIPDFHPTRWVSRWQGVVV